MLFRNGLLTSDLLLKAYNAEYKCINHKGDTLDLTNHSDSKSLYIYEFQRMELPIKYKDKKNTIAFEGKISLYPPGSLHSDTKRFILFLNSTIVPTAGNMTGYLKAAKIKKLEFIEKAESE